MSCHNIIRRGAIATVTFAVALLAPLSQLAEAQQQSQCHMIVHIDNQIRRVRGTVMVECGCFFSPILPLRPVR